MTLSLRQFKAMVAERTDGLPDDEAARVRAELMGNQTLKSYYSEEDKLFVTEGGQVVQTLACQRVALEYPCQEPDDPSHWQDSERGQVSLAQTRNGDIWAFMDKGPLFHSSDGGRSWTWTPGSSTTCSKDFTFTILDDDTFVVVGSAADSASLLVHESADLGKTWQPIATLTPPEPFVVIGDDTPAMTQLSDGSIVLTTQCNAAADWRGHGAHLVHRSTDRGRHWSTQLVTWAAHRVRPDAPEFSACGPQTELLRGESHILDLSGGHLLQTVRFQGLPDEDPWSHLSKTLMFLDSIDGGLTWQNARPALDAGGKPVLKRGECHGTAGQLPDGRIVVSHDCRYPYVEAQTIAHVSCDQGKTWDQRAYHLIFGAGYPATLVLEDGTILTVSGAGFQNERGQAVASRKLWNSVAIRWKLPPA